MRVCLLFFSLILFGTTALAVSPLLWQKNERALALFDKGEYLAAIELLLELTEALPDDPAIRNNLAVAYLGAARQEIQNENYLQALELLARGKEYDDQEARFWSLSGVAYLRSGRYAEAESELNEAWAMSGDEPVVLQYLGQLYYDTDRLQEAVDIWQRALDIAPQNHGLEALLTKARRELVVEDQLDRNYSAHFILSYAENHKADIGGDVLDALEEAYTWAGAKLGHYPERQTPVILYTQRQFRGLTGSPEWAAGLFDGKIRLSIGGLTRVDASVKALLAHEFMHVLVLDMAGRHIPTWLNEGLAEMAASEMHPVNLARLERASAERKLLSLEQMGGSFRQLETDQVVTAYAQSYAFVRYIVERFGWYPLTQLLPLFKDGLSAEEAVKRVYGDYGIDLQILERDWRRQL